MLWVPETDCFAGDSDTTCSEQIFNEWSGTPAVTEVESVVEPDGVADDVRWESVSFIGIHHLILSIPAT